MRDQSTLMSQVWRCCAAAAIAATFGVSALGQDGGIKVSGIGESRAKPTTVEIPAMVRGEAVLAGETLAKFRPAKQRAIEAVEALKVPGLSIREEGFSVNHGMSTSQMQQLMIRGNFNNVQQAQQMKVVMSEELRVNIKGVDKMQPKDLLDTLVKVIDGMKDGGMMLTGDNATPGNYNQAQTMMVFKLENAEGLREEAYRLAIADARQKAERLAKLSGVKLGPVTAITELASGQGAPYVTVAYSGGSAQTVEGTLEPTWMSDVYADIPVRVRLEVKFAIVN